VRKPLPDRLKGVEGKRGKAWKYVGIPKNVLKTKEIRAQSKNQTEDVQEVNFVLLFYTFLRFILHSGNGHRTVKNENE